MNKTQLSIILITLVLASTGFGSLTQNSAAASKEISDTKENSGMSQSLNNGWTHRPVVEHFTGLSCPPCMNGAHPDLSRLWEEDGYTAEQPWNYIEWHEYNGGHVDALATEDTRERMRFYQPGVSGTPDADVDGGYVECGGSHQSNSCDYETVKQALDDSGSRDSSDMKMVNLEVYNHFDSDENKFIMDVNVTYLSTPGGTFDDPRLNGRLFVFMVEDNVTAWSTVNDEYALCHNVFREYAIEDESFTILQPDAGEASRLEFHAEWEIPDTMISDPDNDDEYEEIPIQIPINPLNVHPLAVVYDDDDRQSGGEDRNKDGGNDNMGSPRALQSATPKTTAYDNGNEKPTIEMATPELNSNNFTVSAEISDSGDDVDNAYLVWRNTNNESDATEHWNITVMEKNGKKWNGDITINDTTQLSYGVMTFDSEGVGSISDINFYPAKTVAKDEDNDDDFLMKAAPPVVIGLLAIVGLYVHLHKKNAQG